MSNKEAFDLATKSEDGMERPGKRNKYVNFTNSDTRTMYIVFCTLFLEK